MAVSAQLPKRGAIPSPRSALAAATPHVAVPAAPPNFITKPQEISFWGNYYHGDCVTAEEAFAKACNNPEIFISGDDVITWATSHGVLEGATLTEVMQWMEDAGFLVNGDFYDDGPYFSVNWTDSTILQSAIFQGPVKLGVAGDQLSTAWYAAGGNSSGGKTWFGTGFESDSNEDHCVSLCGYGTINWLAQQLGVPVPTGIDGTKQGYAMFTWDSIGIIDEQSMLAITQEAWLRQPTTVTKIANPTIQWTPGSIAFPSRIVDSGVVKKKVTVNNVGDIVLDVIPSLGPELVGHGALIDVDDQQNNSVLGTSISIPASENAVLTVTFDYSSGIGAHKLNLQLKTNDPTNQNVQIPLSATVRDSRN